MKLKQVLTEGPISYRQGGERYAAWEEPNDDSQDPAPATKQVATIPMTLSDGTKLTAKVDLEFSQEQDAYGKVYVQVHHAAVQSITLPTGQEIEPEVAAQQLGADELDPEGIQYDVEDYLGNALKAGRVEFDRDAVVAIGGGAAPAQAATPAPAAVATPTAA